MSTVHHAYLYWSAMHRGLVYEFCCSYGTCESVLYKYGLHRTAMLFDQKKMERKTRSHVNGLVKVKETI